MNDYLTAEKILLRLIEWDEQIGFESDAALNRKINRIIKDARKHFGIK